ncbi:MAG: hypothetical protein LUI85_18750 [Bacteroides sp.]|nr:hypothetical protein [Bacteroides sp.]
MNRLKYITWILTSIWLIISCTNEDIISPNNNTNFEHPNTVKLNFSAPASTNIIIGRSSEVGDDYLIKDLYLYVFSAESGNIVTLNSAKQPAPIHYGAEQLSDGITGAQEIKQNILGGFYNASWIRFEIDEKAFGTEVYIYMIANTSLYTDILFTENKDLGTITNRQDLDELVNTYNNNIQLDRTHFMMSGHTDAAQSHEAGEEIAPSKLYITKDGTIVRQLKDDEGTVIYTSDASITLERSEAKIEFNFKSGKTGTFNPKSFRIHNYPLKSNTICKYYLQTSFGSNGPNGPTDPNGIKIANKDASSSKEDFFNTNNININGSSFTFYMPENLKYPGKNDNGGTLLGKESNSKLPGEGFRLREKHDKEGNWINAPTLATYVEIEGTYTGTDQTIKDKEVTADIKYFVHLGFSSNQNNTYFVNDYYIMRNYKYIYNSTVNGVNDVITEVNTINETNGTYAEGIVTWQEKDINLINTNSHTLICYQNESLAIDKANNQADDSWLQIKDPNGYNVLTGQPLSANTQCTITASPLPEGTESRTAILKVTRENGWSKSKTVRIIRVIQTGE